MQKYARALYQAIKTRRRPPTPYQVLTLPHIQRTTTSHYLAIVAIVKNEEAYLEEWIDFHTLVGCSQFYIYNNNSSDRTPEILVFPAFKDSLLDVLTDFEDVSALALPWHMFGCSGHATRPAGLVIENYRMRAKIPPVMKDLGKFKSVVDPTRVYRPGTH
jgi:hypothetical protein